MANFLPRNPMPREYRVYPVAGTQMATADELVAVFMDRWHLIGPRIEGNPDTWFRQTAAQLWRTLTYSEISDSVAWLASLLDSMPDQGDRNTLRMLELFLASAFDFSTRDKASRAKTIADRPALALAAA
jgi:hypothetical protein